jgi:hypothetical protein
MLVALLFCGVTPGGQAQVIVNTEGTTDPSIGETIVGGNIGDIVSKKSDTWNVNVSRGRNGVIGSSIVHSPIVASLNSIIESNTKLG